MTLLADQSTATAAAATTAAATPAFPPSEPEEPLPAALEVVAWSDPSFELNGHDPRSAYVERFWLGILGPSTVWMLRRFARGLEECPGGFRVDLAETGRALGLGDSTTRNSTMQRTVQRACQFGAAYRQSPERVAVRTHLPTLTRRQVGRLPTTLQAAHSRWASQPVHADDLRRAAAAAKGLLAAGEPLGAIEHQLRSWGYPPQAIRDASAAAMGWS